mmetsp:Transcript_18822/g.40871  ORF Transcript_18822/g.40871 Transcript_18822/m.40871 type:complete len:100 (+) Transcript_18822:237-536(+)
MTFRALEDIAAGSELTTSYFQANLPLEERRDILTEYGFACACERCVLERSAEDEEVPRIAAWMQRHICSVEDCGGTLAASPGSLDMECNMCGAVRTTKE